MHTVPLPETRLAPENQWYLKHEISYFGSAVRPIFRGGLLAKYFQGRVLGRKPSRSLT